MQANQLRRRLRENIAGRELGWYVAALAVLLLAIGWLLTRLAPPPMPERIVMTTGAEDGAYHRYALRYRDLLAEHGVELVLKPSSGAEENLERLRRGEGGVEVGLVQGGMVREADRETLTTLGSFFYEPIWVFYRAKAPVERVTDLRGLRVAVGRPGSGTHTLALVLARENGLAEAPTTLVETGGLAAAEALADGRLDAAIYVSSIDGPAVQKLLRTPDVRLMNVRRVAAYLRRLPHLHRLELPEGAVDLKRDIPPQSTTLIALTANMTARESLHPVAVELLLEAAREVHGGPSLLHAAGVFPAPLDIELPLDSDAERIFKERPSLLRRVLPLWAAVLAERWVFILLPLLAIAVPAFAYLPKIYDWRIRSKLDSWYAEVHRIERAALEDAGNPQAQLARMQEINARLDRVQVPNAYLSQLYTLRGHAEFVGRLLVERIGAPPAGGA